MSDSKPGSITFFIPCLNEEGNVGRAIDMLAGVMAGRANQYEIVVFDDARSKSAKPFNTLITLF